MKANQTERTPAVLFRNHKTLTLCVLAYILFAAVLPVNAVSKAFLVAAGLSFFIFSVYFDNMFNLGTLFCSLLLLMIGCSQAKLTPVETNDFALMTWLTLIAAILTVVAVIFGCLHVKKKAEARGKKPAAKPALFFEACLSARTVLWANVILLVFEIGIYAWAFDKLGGIPLVDDYLRANLMTPTLGNWVMTLMVLPGMMIIFDVVYIVQTKKYRYFAFILVFTFMIMLLGGRVNIFIPLITAVFYTLLELAFGKRSKRMLIVLCLVLLMLTAALMVAMPIIRTGIYTGSGLKYYEAVFNSVHESVASEDIPADVYGKLPNLLKPVWVNLSTELHGFDWMVKNLSQSGDFQHGKMILLGPFNFIFKHFVSPPSVDVLHYKWLNVLTFMQKPYIDFGIFGVVAFMAVYAFVGMKSYFSALAGRSLFRVLFYAYFCMATAFFIFDNHFMCTTFVVNIVLLFLSSRFFTVDWLARAGTALKRVKRSGAQAAPTDAGPAA